MLFSRYKYTNFGYVISITSSLFIQMAGQSFDIKAARAFQQKKREVRKQALDEKYQGACADFQRIVNMIIQKYKPQKIYQWGSLVRKENFSEISDIDIAVEGLNSAEEFFQLLADAGELTSFPLDIVELEHIHELQRDMIIQTGRLIYAKD